MCALGIKQGLLCQRRMCGMAAHLEHCATAHSCMVRIELAVQQDKCRCRVAADVGSHLWLNPHLARQLAQIASWQGIAVVLSLSV